VANAGVDVMVSIVAMRREVELAAYAAQAKNGGALALPVLFLHAAYDSICETTDSSFAEPMRRDTRSSRALVAVSFRNRVHD
jgi:hypothetical protein